MKYFRLLKLLPLFLVFLSCETEEVSADDTTNNEEDTYVFPYEEKIYDGEDITFTSQEQMEAFDAENYTVINARLYFRLNEFTDSFEIPAFDSFRLVNGRLLFYYNTSISIDGFNNLEEVSYLRFRAELVDWENFEFFNGNIDIGGFERLSCVNYLSLHEFYDFNDLDDLFDKIDTLNGVHYGSQENSRNVDLSILNKFNLINSFFVRGRAINDLGGINLSNITRVYVHHTSLINFETLASINSQIGYLNIDNNESLLTLGGLESITNHSFYQENPYNNIGVAIYNNNSLYNIDAIQNINNIWVCENSTQYDNGYLKVKNNSSLSDFCFLEDAVTTYIDSDCYTEGDSLDSIHIEEFTGNRYNPTFADFVNGDCLL